MIFTVAAIAALCAVCALKAKEPSTRLIFLGFLLFNLVTGAFVILEGNAFKYLPNDPSDNSTIYRR